MCTRSCVSLIFDCHGCYEAASIATKFGGAVSGLEISVVYIKPKYIYSSRHEDDVSGLFKHFKCMFRVLNCITSQCYCALMYDNLGLPAATCSTHWELVLGGSRRPAVDLDT